MKLDFPALGGGGGGGHGAHRFDLFTARSVEPPPLDDARYIIRAGLIAAGIFFGFLLFIAFVAPVSGAAVASGEITTSGTTILVQPVNGGVVSEVYVQEGQHVRAGQPLIRLNGVRSAAAAEQAQAKHDALRALEARLIAERDNLDTISFPGDVASRAQDPTVAAAIAAQIAVFRRHREILGADRSIAATDTDTAQTQHDGAVRELASIRDELRVMQGLYAKGYARLSQVRSLERSETDLETQAATAGTAIARSNLERLKLGDQQVMDTVDELDQVRQQLAQVDPALRVTQYDADRDLLRAQVSGRVAGVAAVGPGTVLGTGRTLMQIVPDGRALIVEAEVKAADINDVKIGATAMLRFPTVGPRGARGFTGKVVTLSPTRVEGTQGTGVYKAQIVVLDHDGLARNDIRILPGQPVTVYIRTHPRTLFSYLFGPIKQATFGAFREQ